MLYRECLRKVNPINKVLLLRNLGQGVHDENFILGEGSRVQARILRLRDSTA